MNEFEVIAPFLAATVRTATPLALAALGEALVERVGIINIGLEGAILAGAFGALVGATAGGLAIGYVAAIGGGLLISAVFAACVVALRTDQIITGTAITLLSVGATGTLYAAMYGTSGAALTLPTSAPVPIPGLSSIPVVGAAFFAQPPVTYAVYVLAPFLAWWLMHTHAGLALRAIGEQPSAAAAAGIRVDRLRVLAVLTGGALGGLAGVCGNRAASAS